MATATLVYLGSGWDLAPGQKHTWIWQEPAHAAVHAFAARPKPRAAASAGHEYQAQIGRVTYSLRTIEGAPAERRVIVEVLNPGADLLNYDLYMSRSD